MPYKVKGIRRTFYTEQTANRIAKEAGIKKPIIKAIKFKNIK